jgi:hypothetical protein
LTSSSSISSFSTLFMSKVFSLLKLTLLNNALLLLVGHTELFVDLLTMLRLLADLFDFRYFSVFLIASSFYLLSSSISSFSFFSFYLYLYLRLPFSSSNFLYLSLKVLASFSSRSIFSLISFCWVNSSCYSLWYLIMFSLRPYSFKYLSFKR